MNLNVPLVATNNFQVNKEVYFIFVRMDDLADMECVESDLLDAPRWDDSIYRCKEKQNGLILFHIVILVRLQGVG